MIRRYSTSFGMASRLLGPARAPAGRERLRAGARRRRDRGRRRRRGGPRRRWRRPPARRARARHRARRSTEGYSANLVVHAFARTARAAGFGAELTEPFFASMRMDLSADRARRRELRALRLRLGRGGRADVPADLPDATPTATTPTTSWRRSSAGRVRSASAFQKVNFLRDLARRRRDPRPQLLPRSRRRDARPTPRRTRCVDDIDADLALAARDPARCCPRSSRRAVALAHGLFAELSAAHPRDPGIRTRPHARARARPREAADRDRSRDARKDRMTRTIVIGGGIAGLATAALLAREGHEVTLLEQHTELGGRAGSWERDGFRFDTGPVVVPDARGVRPLLPHARHDGRRAARPRAARPRLPRLRRGARRAARRRRRASTRTSSCSSASSRARRCASPSTSTAARDLRPGQGALPLLDLPAARPGVRRRRDGAQRAPAAAAARAARQPDEAHGARHPAAPDPRLPGRVPRLGAEARAEHVLADEPPRPGRRRLLPARRIHPGDREDRRPGARPGRRAADRHHRAPHRRERGRRGRRASRSPHGKGKKTDGAGC